MHRRLTKTKAPTETEMILDSRTPFPQSTIFFSETDE